MMFHLKAFAIMALAYLAPLPAYRPRQYGEQPRPFLFNLRKASKRAIALLLALAITSLSLAPIAEAKRVAIGLGNSGAPYTFNLKASNTAAIRTAWAGGSNVLFPIVGDSTSRGQSAGVGTAQAVNSWPMQMAGILRGMGINAGADNVFADGGSWGQTQNIANFQSGDGRVTATGATALGGTLVEGGNAFNWNATGALNFTAQEPVDRMVIWWRDASAGRNFNWQVDGGPTAGQQINSSGTTQLVLTSPLSMGPVATHTFTLNWVAGAITIVGMSAYDSTRGKELSLLNWGICGANSANLINNTDNPGAGRLLTITQTQPPGLLAEMGAINNWRASTTVASFKADTVTMVQTVKAYGGNPILITPVFDPSSTGNAANQTQYVAAMYQVAAEYDIPLFDIRKKWGSNANAVANGWQPAGDVHPTTAGYADIAQSTANMIKAIINNTFADNEIPLKPEKRWSDFAAISGRDIEAANDNWPVWSSEAA